MLSILSTLFTLAAAHGSALAPDAWPTPLNDNVPSVTICDEALAAFAPLHRRAGAKGQTVIDVDREIQVVDLRRADLRDELAQVALALPRLAVSARGVIVLLGRSATGRMFVRRSIDEDRPFEMVRFDWLVEPKDPPAHVTASPDGNVLALQDAKKTKLSLVDARTGRVLFERASFRREAEGVHAFFNHDNRTVGVQRDGFLEILELGDPVEFVKGYSFGHAMKSEDVELPTSKTSHLEFDSRGEIHALSSRTHAVQFFKSEPLLLVSLEKNGTYRHLYFDPAPPTEYRPSTVPENLEEFAWMSFRFLDAPNQPGLGFVSPRETMAVEFRYQYHEADRQSFLDLFDIATRKHVRTIGFHGSITKVAFSSDERFVAVTTTRKTVRVYDFQDGGAAAWFAVDDVPLAEDLNVLSFTRTGDLLVGSTAAGKLLRYPLP